MSERLKSTGNMSNEAVIEDLTKDLRNINTQETYDDFVIDPEPSNADVSPVHLSPEYPSDPSRDKDQMKKGGYTSQEEKSDAESEDDDEESLKDAEVDLTDDQKEERRLIAEGLKVAGNQAFKDEDYERSIEKYSEGLRTCPLQFKQQRAVLLCNRGAALMKLCRYKRAARDCSRALELDDQYLKAYIRRAQSYEALEKYDESLADYNKILEFDSTHKEAISAMVRLPPLIDEKNEKLKKEMLGKLKDLGNMILKPFGLSTENFQLEQDPESKGYKINFKQ